MVFVQRVRIVLNHASCIRSCLGTMAASIALAAFPAAHGFQDVLSPAKPAKNAALWEPLQSLDIINKEMHSDLGPQVRKLLHLIDSSDRSVSGQAILSLSETMLTLASRDDEEAAQKIAMAIFYGSNAEFDGTGKARQRAFNVLYIAAGNRPPAGVRSVTIEAPNITCHGRFLDSLNEHVRDANPWILRTEVELQAVSKLQPPQTQPVRYFDGSEPLDFGSAGLTIIRFFIAQDKSPVDLARAVAATNRYSMKNWKVLTPLPIEMLLKDARLQPAVQGE